MNTTVLHDHRNPIYGNPWHFSQNPIQNVSDDDSKSYDYIVWYSYMDGACEWHSCREFFNTIEEAESFVKTRKEA